MLILYFALTAILSSEHVAAKSCNDYSGIFYSEDPIMPNCLVTEQIGCDRLVETVYAWGSQTKIEFLTDGLLRRYSIEPSVRKAFDYDSKGNLIFMSLDDNGRKIEGYYEILASGDIRYTTTWTESSGSVTSQQDISVKMPSLKQCLSLLNQPSDQI